MLKTGKFMKDPLKILKINNKECEVVSKQIKMLKQQIRNMISKILDFSDSSNKSQTLIELSLNTQLSPTELLRQWNDSIMTQLKKFAFKINTILQLNKNEQMNKMRPEIGKKLQKCSSDIIGVIQKIFQKEKWCLCKRETCSMRVQPAFTQRKIKNYVFSNIGEGIINEQLEFLKNVEQGSIDFFNIKQSADCNLISLKMLDSNTKQSQKEKNRQNQIVQFLLKLKINDNQRSECNLDESWIRKFSSSSKEYPTKL